VPVARDPRGELRRELARLESLQRELAGGLQNLRSLLDATDATPAIFNRPTNGGRPRPVRGLVLDALTDLGVLAFTREVSAYIASRYDRTIPASRFGALTADEVESYVKRSSNKSRRSGVRLCFGITAEDARPIKRILARSDWPLEQRIWGPLTGRAQHLKMTIRLCELASALTKQAINPHLLHELAVTYARDLPVRVDPSRYDYEAWVDRGNELLRENDLLAIDHEQRLEAAERWTGLSEEHQLFGRPETG
jgi:hypothetical protein